MKKFLLTIILIILLSITVTAGEHITKGVDNSNSYTTTGVGGFLSLELPYQTSISGDFRGGVLTKDLDGDGVNELITVDGTSEQLKIYNYSISQGIVLQDAINIGDLSYSTNGNAPFYQTPALIDYDGDTYTEIIVFNATHFSVYNYSSSGLVQEQTTTHGISRPASMSKTFAKYPVIKCSDSTKFIDSKVHCVTPAQGTNDHRIIQYNLGDNLANSTLLTVLPNDDESPYNTHLADIDNDGYDEAIVRLWDDPNKRIIIDKIEITVSGASVTNIYDSGNIGGSAQTGDVTVNNLDGASSNGQEITFAWTTDSTNWDAITIDNTGAVLENDYCSIITCPEGEKATFNNFVCSSTEFCDFPDNDVCYYIRNSENNDPTKNIDKIHCVSLRSGTDNTITQVINTVNFTKTYPIIHKANVFEQASLLMTDWQTLSSIRIDLALNTDEEVYAVDYENNGLLDIIGYSSTSLTFYDDNLENSQVQITDVNVNTGNPICENVAVTVSFSVDDPESDNGYCEFNEYYSNNTLISNWGNETFDSTTLLLSSFYYADAIGGFILKLECTDSYHDTKQTYSYPIVVSNNSVVCNNAGENPFTKTLVVDEEQESDDAFDESVDELLEEVGVESKKAKNILAVVIIALSCLGFYFKMKSPMAIPLGIAVGLILDLSFGLITLIPVMIFSIVLVLLIIVEVKRMFGNGGGV